MNRDNGLRFFGEKGFHRLTRNIPSLPVNIGENGFGSPKNNGVGGRNKAETGNDNFIPRAHARQETAEFQGRRAAGDEKSMLRFARFTGQLFKGRRFRTASAPLSRIKSLKKI